MTGEEDSPMYPVYSAMIAAVIIILVLATVVEWSNRRGR